MSKASSVVASVTQHSRQTVPQSQTEERKRQELWRKNRERDRASSSIHTPLTWQLHVMMTSILAFMDFKLQEHKGVSHTQTLLYWYLRRSLAPESWRKPCDISITWYRL